MGDFKEKADGSRAETLAPDIYGLVLAGGASRRMQADKGALVYHGKNQRTHVYEMLAGICKKVFISYSPGSKISAADNLPFIIDSVSGSGPYGALLSAFEAEPVVAWFIVACDMPLLTAVSLEYLVKNRNPFKIATAFRSEDFDGPEPLVSIWEPGSYPLILEKFKQGICSMKSILSGYDAELLTVPSASELQNVNTPEEKEIIMRGLKGL